MPIDYTCPHCSADIRTENDGLIQMKPQDIILCAKCERAAFYYDGSYHIQKQNTQPGHGSIDPYFDISELLDKLGVCYLLIVARPGETGYRTWSNMRDWQAGKENIKTTMRDGVEAVIRDSYGEG